MPRVNTVPPEPFRLLQGQALPNWQTAPARARRRLEALILTLVLSFGAAAFVRSLGVAEFRQRVLAQWNAGEAELYRLMFQELLLNPWFYLVIGSVLLCERRWPARPEQGLLSAGARVDMVWVVVKLLLHASFFPVYAIFLRFVYGRYLDETLTIASLAGLPWGVRLVLGLLLGDLVFYVSHVLRHKIPLLWRFHAVHHSQRQLNFFTEYRVHPFDDVFLFALTFIPLLMLGHTVVTATAIVWLGHWHTRICHANIRTNFGPLRFLLVTPQSHRVHHSREAHHLDRNFGLTFCLWDRLFGTHYPGETEYPETGILAGAKVGR